MFLLVLINIVQVSFSVIHLCVHLDSLKWNLNPDTTIDVTCVIRLGLLEIILNVSFVFVLYARLAAAIQILLPQRKRKLI